MKKNNDKINNVITKGTGLIDHYIFRKIIIKLFKYFNFKKIHPNLIVLINFFLVLFSFFLIIKKNFILAFLGLFIYLFYDLLDLLDGAIARYYNKTSNFGAFFDSFIDFLSEILILIAISIYFNKVKLFFYLVFFILFTVYFNNKIKCDFNIKERQLNILELSKSSLLTKIKYFLVIITRNDSRKLLLIFGFIVKSYYIIFLYFLFLYLLVFLNNIIFLIKVYRK